MDLGSLQTNHPSLNHSHDQLWLALGMSHWHSLLLKFEQHQSLHFLPQELIRQIVSANESSEARFY